MIQPRSPLVIKKTPIHNTRKHAERIPNKFDIAPEFEELQAMSDYEDTKMDFFSLQYLRGAYATLGGKQFKETFKE